MAVNKVIFGGEVVVDLTGDSVTAEKMLLGETAHNKSGEPTTGTIETFDGSYECSGESTGGSGVGSPEVETCMVTVDNWLGINSSCDSHQAVLAYTDMVGAVVSETFPIHGFAHVGENTIHEITVRKGTILSMPYGYMTVNKKYVDSGAIDVFGGPDYDGLYYPSAVLINGDCTIYLGD